MTITDACCLLKEFAECPRCHSVYVGNGSGTVEIDTEKGLFRRTCKCGWGVTINTEEGDRR